MFRGSIIAGSLLFLVTGCADPSSEGPGGARDRGAADRGSGDGAAPGDTAADRPRADTTGDADLATTDALGEGGSPAPCPKRPCATRPILFLHGFRGSNHDYLDLLKALVKQDSRFDGYRLSGVKDPTGWAAGAWPRRAWLVAFDYYINKAGDGRGSYTAGPGRIGSNSGHVCSKPPGNGFLVADDGDHGVGISHDYAADLAGLVNRTLAVTGAAEVDIVAHSMGGLVVRSYLSYYGGAARVRRVLLLASPVKGIALVGFLNLFPVGQPKWMTKNEVAELDAGSLLSKIRFTRCGVSPPSYGAWAKRLTEHEVKSPPAVQLHVMSGLLDPVVNYLVANHPQALSHKTALAHHAGILSHGDTLKRVMQLMGGSTGP